MEVICIQDDAFINLLDRVIKHIDKKMERKQEKWVSGQEAMKLLRITSKATLQKFRDEGKIRFSQPEKKIILYDTDSINDFLNDNTNK